LIVRTLKLVGCLVALSLCSLTAAAQGPKPGVAPPPADLEPGVNTSATQPSSPEPQPAAPPAPAPKPAAATQQKQSRSGTATSPSSASGSAAGANSTASSAGAKPGHATAAAAPKTGAGAGKAHDNLELDTTQITGNRELPKVLYIVPWKRSDLGDLVGKPMNSLLDEVLTPVDRDVFKRQNRYYDALKPDAAGNAGAASDPAK
jgi:hypothetical protein